MREDERARPTYADVRAFMAELVSKYPKNAAIVQIGASDSGQTIEGIAIGNGSVKNLVVATHHGNEYGSTEVARAFAESLVANPISDQTVYVIPVLNIEGYNARQRWERTPDGRFNDPNRDYPGPCGTDGPHRLKSTAALADFIAREEIVASATLHTFYPAVVYPWGLSTRDTGTAYPDIFKMLVQAAVVESRYPVGNSTDVIYPADGTYEDYAYWRHGVWSILFELGYSHSPSQSDIDEMKRLNVPGLRRMLELSPRQRAENHDFTGRCDTALRALDLHIE
jgi:hypothetical protein